MHPLKKVSSNIYNKDDMSKYGLYSKSQIDESQHINVCEMNSILQAEAYFAGVKQLTLEQFKNLFVVKEIKTNRGLLYGNR